MFSKFWNRSAPVLAIFLFILLTGCDNDIKKRDQVAPAGAKFAGEGTVAQYFWDGENQCRSTYQVSMLLEPNKKAVMTATGPEYTFGPDCQRAGEVTYTIRGTYRETNLDDNSTDSLQTEFTFSDCNDGAFTAKGNGYRTGEDPILGNVKCYTKDGEILMEMGFNIRPVTGV